MTKTFNYEILFQKNSKNNIVRYSDLDYIKLIAKKKFIRVYIFIFIRKSISHSLKFKLSISLLSCKTKYKTLIEMAKILV